MPPTSAKTTEGDPLQEWLALPSIYIESEERFKKLPRAQYHEWVVGAYPWKVWGHPWAAFGGWEFSLAASGRARGDPERLSREERQRRGEGYGKQYEKMRRKPVEFYEKAILKATKDGRPRTLNRIAVEAFDMTGEILPHTATQAFYNLIYQHRLAFALIGFDDPSRPLSAFYQRRRPDEHPPYILLWNDAGWRKRHPGVPAPAHKRLGQMLLESRELPSEGRI